MKISTQKPPVWDEVEKKFGIKWESGVLVAYGDTIHTRTGRVSPDLIIHESVHFKQQEAIGGPEKWWEKYLTDSNFRFEQELEAYGKQCDYIRSYIHNHKKRANMFNHIWHSMAEMYGDMVTYKQAAELLPEFGKNKSL